MSDAPHELYSGRMNRMILVALPLVLAGCSERAATWTLYRNSSAAGDARIHFATFNSSQSDPNFNAANCAMAMDLLNKNVARLNEGEHPVSFWCERGGTKDLS